MRETLQMLKFFLIFVSQMNLSPYIIKRKLATLLLITASVAAFATLGDSGGKRRVSTSNNKNLLLLTPTYNYKVFSLRTGYNYRGTSVINTTKTAGRYIQLNSVVTFEKGNSIFILPIKKTLLLDKIRFNPAATR